MSKFYFDDLIDDSWKPFFSFQITESIHNIEKTIDDNYNPSPQHVLRFATTNLHAIKVIILGQDPYPQKGIPTGRSFEVNDLHSWCDKFKQTSLRNLLRNLYRTYTGELKTLAQIREEIKSDSFKILTPDKIFDYWESQGVLMLNTYLTCRIGEPGSHRDLWEPITKQLIEFIASTNNNIVWFLWGKDAQSVIPLIGDKSKKYISNHPMIANPKNESDFLNNRCFLETKESLGIDWLGSPSMEMII